MSHSLSKGVFVFQFLSNSLTLYREQRTTRHFNSSVYNLSHRMHRRFERLIWKYRIGFIRLLLAAEIVYFRHFYNKKSGRRKLISFIICCDDYPYTSRIHLYLRITPKFDKILFVQALLVNFSEDVSVDISNAVAAYTNEPLSFFEFHQSHSFRYPPNVFLSNVIAPCASFSLERPIHFGVFCSI